MQSREYKYTRKQISTEVQLKAELRRLSLAHPEKWYTFDTTFTMTYIHEYTRKPSGQTYDAESTFRRFAGFWHGGKIIPPARSWIDTFNRLPCRDY